MCAKQNEECCATVTWEIRNYSLLLEGKQRELVSPFWNVENTERSADWRILQTWRSNSKLYFDLYSYEEYMGGRKYDMSLVSSTGEVPLEQGPLGISFIEEGVVLGQSRQSLLPKDILTLRCRGRVGNKTIRNRELSIHSDLHRVNYQWKWNIEHFNTYNIYNTFIMQDNFLLYVSLLKKSFNDATHIVTLEGQCEEKCISFIDCKMSFKDDGSYVTDNICRTFFNRWKCYVKIDTENNTNVCVELKPIVALHNVCNTTELAESNLSGEIAQSSGAVCDVFLLLFKEKLFCDATLTTDGQSFSAHRGVLAARSPVFRAMFEKRETSESRSGVVAIDDVDGATLERMLVFLYSGHLEKIGWDEAAALYYAADKYDVCPLKLKCAEFLKTGLTADNVCDALVMADRHSDQDLLTSVVDFLFEHQEVMSSNLWEELEDSQGRLCAKITRRVLFKKGKNS